MACKMRLRYMCFRSYQFHYNAAVSGRKKSQRYKNLSFKIKERLWIKVKTVDIWKNVIHLLINNSRERKKTPVRLHIPAGREYQGRHERGKARSVGSGGIHQRNFLRNSLTQTIMRLHYQKTCTSKKCD